MADLAVPPPADEAAPPGTDQAVPAASRRRKVTYRQAALILAERDPVLAWYCWRAAQLYGAAAASAVTA